MVNQTDLSPHIKSAMFKVGIVLASAFVGFIIDGKFNGRNNFYGIMKGRLNSLAP